MSILEHVWGQSPGVDRVWAQVAGMAPSLIGRRHFMILQAFFDESEGADGTFVIGGHLASVEGWAELTKEWERLLPLARPKPVPQIPGTAIQRFRPKDERQKPAPSNADFYRFKASELAHSEEGLDVTRAFLRVIEERTLLSVSVRINRRELERAQRRVHVPGVRTIVWGKFRHPYVIAFWTLMDGFFTFAEMPQSVIPPDAKIDFYFDDRSDKALVANGWDSHLDSMSEARRARVGQGPRFEDDEEFMGLQAADLWAHWVQVWHAQGEPQKVGAPELGGRVSDKQHPKIDIVIDEQNAVQTLTRLATRQSGRQAYDIRSKVDLSLWRPA